MLPGSPATDLHYFVATVKFPGGDFWENWEQPREKVKETGEEVRRKQACEGIEKGAAGSEALAERDLRP